MSYGQQLSWVVRKKLAKKVVMQLMFYNFGGAVGELSKIIWRFGLWGVAVAASDRDEDDWESGWTERRLDLVKKDGGVYLINDVCD